MEGCKHSGNVCGFKNTSCDVHLVWGLLQLFLFSECVICCVYWVSVSSPPCMFFLSTFHLRAPFIMSTLSLHSVPVFFTSFILSPSLVFLFFLFPPSLPAVPFLSFCHISLPFITFPHPPLCSSFPSSHFETCTFFFLFPSLLLSSHPPLHPPPPPPQFLGVLPGVGS